jgi:hypothetical protein
MGSRRGQGDAEEKGEIGPRRHEQPIHGGSGRARASMLAIASNREGGGPGLDNRAEGEFGALAGRHTGTHRAVHSWDLILDCSTESSARLANLPARCVPALAPPRRGAIGRGNLAGRMRPSAEARGAHAGNGPPASPDGSRAAGGGRRAAGGGRRPRCKGQQGGAQGGAGAAEPKQRQTRRAAVDNNASSGRARTLQTSGSGADKGDGSAGGATMRLPPPPPPRRHASAAAAATAHITCWGPWSRRNCWS